MSNSGGAQEGVSGGEEELREASAWPPNKSGVSGEGSEDASALVPNPESAEGEFADPFLEWKTVNSSGTISARHGHTAVVYNNCMWVFGGDGKDNKRIDQVHYLKIPSYSWHTVRTGGDNNTKPECRSGHSAVMYQDEMIIFGGRNGRSHFADLCRFSFTEKRWRKIKTTGSLVKRRYRHTAVVYESKMCVVVFLLKFTSFFFFIHSFIHIFLSK